MVAGATRLIAGASGTTPDGGVRFLGECSIMAGAFALGKVLNFGSLAYITDYCSELRPLHEATPVGSKPPVWPSPPRFLGADLEVLARQIQCSLGPNPTVSDHCCNTLGV